MIAVYATAIASPLDKQEFLLPSPCPESYQPCCTSFNGICNAQILRKLTGLKPGQTVAVLLPDHLSNGSSEYIGYYAHALAKLVGQTGHVYTIAPQEISEDSDSTIIRGRVVTGDYSDQNVTRLIMPFSELSRLPRLDLVWAVQRGEYRPLSFFKPLQATSSFLPLFKALRPHGRFIILDVDTQRHCGRPSPSCPALGPILLDAQPHDVVLRHVQQAGFELISETRRLDDPALPAPAPGINGTLADGSTTYLFPFLWVFQRSP